MGRTELAANLFRITQTEERIKSRKVQGQRALEQTHYDVGKEVRKIVIDNTGKAPEQLKQEKEIPDLRRELKAGFKEMKKIDKPKKIKNRKDEQAVSLILHAFFVSGRLSSDTFYLTNNNKDMSKAVKEIVRVGFAKHIALLGYTKS